MVFKAREREGETGRRVVKSKKMDAMRHTLPRLQLTVPMPMKMGKVGLTLEASWYVYLFEKGWHVLVKNLVHRLYFYFLFAVEWVEYIYTCFKWTAIEIVT